MATSTYSTDNGAIKYADKPSDAGQSSNRNMAPRVREPSTPAAQRRISSKTRQSHRDTTIDGYQLGDCLGKGAFGSVFRALNMGTGETVAVKQIKMADLPKSELRVITLEIDLLKNLDHPNIVKYRGFEKSAESLNIILEYCENGSLHSISKNFGKFPENLVGIYMSQVLHGLLYLHEQGVIHRDIKGANILTTKQGLVKLADFGVATRTSAFHDSSVVGTPYWMAPEVIELSGATTASDIWSLGCTVIELLDGKPPYHKLQPMHALFRIVNDDHPPLPEGSSPVVRDFLMQCFQKDPNLRVPAQKLLRHPWIINAKRSDAVVPKKPTEYNEAVRSVQEWNEALRAPTANTNRHTPRLHAASPVPALDYEKRDFNANLAAKAKFNNNPIRPAARASDDTWDDDFATDEFPASLTSRPAWAPDKNGVLGGILSAERLRSFASFEVPRNETNWDDNFEGDLTIRSPFQKSPTDPLQTAPQSDRESAQIISSHTVSPIKTHLNRDPYQAQKIDPDKSKPKTSPKQASQKSSRQQLKKLNTSLSPNKKLKTPEILPGTHTKSPAPLDGSHEPGQNHTSHRAIYSSQCIDRSPDFEAPRDQPKANMLQRSNVIKSSGASAHIQQFAEDVYDEDFSDVLTSMNFQMDSRSGSERGPSSENGTLMLSSKFYSNSWKDEGDGDEEDDPFAKLEETFDELDLEANVARDKFAQICTQMEGLVASLKVYQKEETLQEVSDRLLECLVTIPETRAVLISAHGMLPILEILEATKDRDVILSLLRAVNTLILGEVEIQENLCFVGGIPIITKYASKKYSSEVRLEAAAFIRQMFQTSAMTLQMFVSAGGLKVLVEFLEEDYEDERDLVLSGVNGIWSVFELQGPTPKNDFCRILSRNSVLDPLSLVLSRVLDEGGSEAELCEGRIANIFFLFSQAENHVKETIAERTVLHRILKELRRMTAVHQVTMLKFIKNLSMLSTTLDALQNSNAIDVLIELLRTSTQRPHHREIWNQILNTIFNLCRLNKSRQEDAALNGVVPVLQRIISDKGPLKEFALPVLCDMASSGKVGRRELWRNKGLAFYVSLLSDEFWQVTALDAIFIWLQEETAKVEDHLIRGNFVPALVRCFTDAKANAFENLLEPLQKLLRLSPPVALCMASESMFQRVLQKLQSGKAVVRLNLLRIVRSICDASDEASSSLQKYQLQDTIQRLASSDSAVLVRNLASELLKLCETRADASFVGTKRPGMHRPGFSHTSSRFSSRASTPISPVLRNSSLDHALADEESDFAEKERRSRLHNSNGIGVMLFDSVTSTSRPIPTHHTKYNHNHDNENCPSPTLSSTSTSTTSSNPNTIAIKSRLPRTTTSRTSSRPIPMASMPSEKPSAIHRADRHDRPHRIHRIDK